LVIMFFTWFFVTHVNIFTSDISKCCHQQPFLIYRTNWFWPLRGLQKGGGITNPSSTFI
jgi:hypothetical protein